MSGFLVYFHVISDIELSDEDEEYGSGNESGGSEDSIEVCKARSIAGQLWENQHLAF